MPEDRKKRHSDRPRTFPVILYRLTEANSEYEMGFRYRVHDIDDDLFYFHDEDRMREVLMDHAMMPVKPEEMERIRARRKTSTGTSSQPGTDPGTNPNPGPEQPQ